MEASVFFHVTKNAVCVLFSFPFVSRRVYLIIYIGRMGIMGIMGADIGQ